MPKLSLLPLLSEKTIAQGEELRTYTFMVPKSAGKLEIAEAIKTTYKVKTVSVRTATIKGKAISTLVQRGRRRVSGQRSDYKKAYISLAEGEEIKLVEEKK